MITVFRINNIKIKFNRIYFILKNLDRPSEVIYNKTDLDSVEFDSTIQTEINRRKRQHKKAINECDNLK